MAYTNKGRCTQINHKEIYKKDKGLFNKLLDNYSLEEQKSIKLNVGLNV